MVKTKDSIEIYFDDLNENAQKEILTIFGIKDPEELNADIIPLAVIPFEVNPNLN